MSAEKAFKMISDEIELMSELSKFIKTEANRMDMRRRQIISKDKSSAFNNMNNLQKHECMKDILEVMTKGGNLIDKKIDNVIEKIMFIIHIGGTCKSLTLNDTDMILADMNLMMQRLQGTQKNIHSNLVLIEKCYKHLYKD
jgi:hypothetical protein